MEYKKYTIDDLTYIMKILRSKNGCPWDKKQSHETLKKYLVEEVYEVLDTLGKDDEKFCDELGDLLLQVVFHAQLAKERNAFDMEDIINGICDKMIRRHTHVFGKDDLKSSDEVLTNWNSIKMKEKDLKSYTDTLKNVPISFPGLLRSFEIQKKAAKVGFDWDTKREAFEKIKEESIELEEIYETNNKKNIEEEIGDLLFAVVNVARFCDIQPEIAINNTAKKFIKRFEYIEKKAISMEKDMKEMSLDEMDEIWEEAKKKSK